MPRKTIVMLSAKRCGTTAIFTLFQKHPDVGVCHVDQNIDLWEPNFWNLAAEAIKGSPEKFILRFEQSHPFLLFPKEFTEETVFTLWDNILEELGPVVFDKSPQYLGNTDAIDLLSNYIKRGNDVRLFAFIRDPRDAITSQYEQWKNMVEDDSPKKRELAWLEKYQHLELIQKIFYVPLFRYEDFSSAPSCYAYNLLQHCGVSVLPETYGHIKPTSVGRYSISPLPAIRTWKFGPEFIFHLRKYGYKTPQFSILELPGVYAGMYGPKIKRRISSFRKK
jgi:hypothetical protein